MTTYTDVLIRTESRQRASRGSNSGVEVPLGTAAVGDAGVKTRPRCR